MLDILLLFPPNWSACVNSPHLALPLMAGALTNSGYKVETIDLSNLYYQQFDNIPDQNKLELSCKTEDFGIIDQMYFKWQEPFEEIAKRFNSQFGLISGFTGDSISSYNFEELLIKTHNGTPFTSFYETEVHEIIREKDPVFIGISVASFNQFIASVELIQYIKHHFPEINIILGGNYITRLKGKETLRHLSKLTDGIILFQGENQILDIVKALKTNRTLKKISIGDDLVPNKWHSPYFNGIELEAYPGAIKMLPIVFTRGCYYNKCSFCTIPAAWSNKGYVGISDSSFIVKQINHLIERYKIKNFKIIDESFIPKRINDFLKLDVEFYWEAYVRVERFWEKYENVQKAFNTGCRKLYFGLEQAPDTNVEPLNKRNNGDILRIIENCNKAGIKIHIFTMIGYPGTTIEDAEKTAEFLLEYSDFIDTADISGFRMERIIENEFVKPILHYDDLKLHYDFIAKDKKALSSKDVQSLENQIIDIIWENAPKLIHPLYRIGQTWN